MKHSENKEATKYAFLAPLELKARVRQKCIMIGILFGLLLPIVILESIGFPYRMEYLVRFVLATSIFIPIIAYLAYQVMQRLYKCPKCNSLWCYQTTGETIIDSLVISSNDPQGSNKPSTIEERYLLEYECYNCHHKDFKPKKRKIIEQREVK
jgi:hypothetical protein